MMWTSLTATSTTSEVGRLPDSPLKLYFDECVGGPTVERIKAVFQPSPDRYLINSIFDEGWRGESDRLWTERILPEGWVLVTADKGRKKRGDKLPILCFRLGITHVRLTPTVHNLQTADKAPFLVAAVREWTPTTFGEPGRCFSLTMEKNGRPKLTDRTEAARRRYTPGNEQG